MSLLSSIILPQLEAELVQQEPAIAEFLIKQIHKLASEVIIWAEVKVPSLAGDQNAAS